MVEQALVNQVVLDERMTKFYKQMGELERLLADSFVTSTLEDGDHSGLDFL